MSPWKRIPPVRRAALVKSPVAALYTLMWRRNSAPTCAAAAAFQHQPAAVSCSRHLLARHRRRTRGSSWPCCEALEGIRRQYGASKRTLPPPARIDRDGVRPEETKECQCEIALLAPSLDLASSELRDAVMAHLREARSDTVFNRLVAVTAIRELVRRAATRTSDGFLWSDRSRALTNVIIKRELEVGDGGGLTYRWAEFTTGENILRTTLFVPGIVVPLALHRLALRRAANVLGISLESETVTRFTAHGSSPLIFMDDMDPKITEPFLLSVPYSNSDWSFETRASASAGLRAVVVRLLIGRCRIFRPGKRPSSSGGFTPSDASASSPRRGSWCPTSRLGRTVRRRNT